MFSPEFAALHVRFAFRVSEVSGLDVPEALGTWTPARRLAGPAWTRTGLWADRLCSAYRARYAWTGPATGCFSCELEDGERVARLHFFNREGRGVLGPDRLQVRRSELALALRDARQRAPHARTLHGGSWLYHLEAYRALFPPSFLQTAVAVDSRSELQTLGLWGQFLRGDGGLHGPRSSAFIAAFDHASSTAELVAAFPLPKLEVTGSLDDVLAWLRDPADRAGREAEGERARS